MMSVKVKMKNISLYKLFNYLAIAGNVLFILWVTYNGIDEGFQRHASSDRVVCRLDVVAGAQYGFDFEKREVNQCPAAINPSRAL